MIRFSFTTTQMPEGLLIKFIGSMDENMKLNQIQLKDGGTIIFDLGEVTRINSIGIREWIIWINRNAANHKIIFRNCPRAIIDQANLVPGFLPPAAVIESFHIPFACFDCNTSDTRIMQMGKDFVLTPLSSGLTIHMPSAPQCPNCGKQMVFDAIEQTYFQFLKSRAQGSK